LRFAALFSLRLKLSGIGRSCFLAAPKNLGLIQTNSAPWIVVLCFLPRRGRRCSCHQLPTFSADAKPRPKVGIIGCGWYAGVNYEAFVRNVELNVVSLCDVNQHSLQKTLQAVAKHQTAVPRTFVDYREMLSSGEHDIVIVATPDHWHALPAIAAMKAGADIYLEKPVSVDVIEGEALVAARATTIASSR